MSADLRSAALAYASRGIPVLPLHYPVACLTAARPVPVGQPPAQPTWSLACSCGDRACGQVGKHPLGALVPHGLKEATTNRARVLAWWTQHSQANVGLATGHRFDVLDLDAPPGIQALRQFAAKHQITLPARGPVVRSGRNQGGWHYYLTPAGLPRRPRLLEGSTTRRWAATWSPHPAGTLRATVTPGRATSTTRCRPCPGRSMRGWPSAPSPTGRPPPSPSRCRRGRGTPGRARRSPTSSAASPPPAHSTRPARRAQRGAVGGRPQPLQPGRLGRPGRAEVETGLLEAADRCGLLQDEPRQTYRTLASARQVGLEHPRRPPERTHPTEHAQPGSPSPAARAAGERTRTHERR